MTTLFKYIFAFILFLTVLCIICLPFYAIYQGFVMVASGSLWGILLIAVGLIVLRLFKPISNLYENKDFKIF